MTEVREFSQCRACHGSLGDILSLGDLAVSDFTPPGTPVDRAPLDVVRCNECELVQLRHSVDRNRLYRHYYYRSGTNESMVAALQNVVVDAVRQVTLDPGDSVVDIGCNDGTMLRMFPDHVDRIGFEPARNLWPVAARPGNSNITIVPGFFPDYLPSHLRAIRPKIVTAIAMFYDLDDPGAFLDQVKAWLHPEGVFVLQLSYLPMTLQTNNVGDFCHEHVTYWHLYPLTKLLASHGFRPAQISFNQVNGGSVRLVCRHAEPNRQEIWGDHLPASKLSEFRARVGRLRDETICLLQEIRWAGRTVCGLGASTKGNTLLQYYGITPDLLPAIADRSPEKVGLVTAGSNIPIIGEAEARLQRPDDLFVLPFHFLDSILARERALYDQGTRFMVPLPELRVISKEDQDADVQPKAARATTRSGLAS